MTANTKSVHITPSLCPVVGKTESEVEQDSYLWPVRCKTQYREGRVITNDIACPLAMCGAFNRDLPLLHELMGEAQDDDILWTGTCPGGTTAGMGFPV